MYIDETFNLSSLLHFLQNFRENGDLEAIEIIKNDKTILKYAISPYRLADVRQVFSVSKSFTSLAIGLAYDQKKLKLEDRVIDFFPDKLPSKISPNLKKMTVYHLLTMTCGHEKCFMNQMKNSTDPVREFFLCPVFYEPGTHFVYNSGASFLLSAIISRLYRARMAEVLYPVFKALQIKSFYWEQLCGIDCGGYGLHLSIHDLSKLGQLLLHKGRYNHKQIISEEYCNLATSKQVSTDHNGTADWCSGYGFQFWMNQDGGFRADGASGQLCLVYPEEKLVIAVQACIKNMQKEIDDLQKIRHSYYHLSTMTEDVSTKIQQLWQIPKKEKMTKNYLLLCSENALTIQSIHLFSHDNEIELKFQCSCYHFSLKSGYQKYAKSAFYAKGFKTKLSDIMKDEYEKSIVSSYYVYEKNSLTVVLKNHNTPLVQTFEFQFQEDGCIVTINCHKINAVYGGNIS